MINLTKDTGVYVLGELGGQIMFCEESTLENSLYTCTRSDGFMNIFTIDVTGYGELYKFGNSIYVKDEEAKKIVETLVRGSDRYKIEISK